MTVDLGPAVPPTDVRIRCYGHARCRLVVLIDRHGHTAPSGDIATVMRVFLPGSEHLRSIERIVFWIRRVLDIGCVPEVAIYPSQRAISCIRSLAGQPSMVNVPSGWITVQLTWRPIAGTPAGRSVRS